MRHSVYDMIRRPFGVRDIHKAAMERKYPLQDSFPLIVINRLDGGPPINSSPSGIELPPIPGISVKVRAGLPPPPPERIIPILTGEDTRLTTSIPQIDSNTKAWFGFDSSMSSLFHSSLYNNTGHITWIGTEQFVLASIQFTPQGGYASRLPQNIEIFGSNDSGATWTSIVDTNVNYSSSELIFCTDPVDQNPYTCFKIQIKSCTEAYVTFADMVLKGWKVE